MKRIVLLALVSLFAFQCTLSYAQNPRHGGPHERQGRRPDITKIVSNLSDAQKEKLETLMEASRQCVDKLRRQQQAVRDSIALYMDRDGNQSKKLYPLFDREAKLQVEISREMYNTKVRIDEVLTKEQRQQFRQASKEHRKHKNKKK